MHIKDAAIEKAPAADALRTLSPTVRIKKKVRAASEQPSSGSSRSAPAATPADTTYTSSIDVADSSSSASTRFRTILLPFRSGNEDSKKDEEDNDEDDDEDDEGGENGTISLKGKEISLLALRVKGGMFDSLDWTRARGEKNGCGSLTDRSFVTLKCVVIPKSDEKMELVGEYKTCSE